MKRTLYVYDGRSYLKKENDYIYMEGERKGKYVYGKEKERRRKNMSLYMEGRNMSLMQYVEGKETYVYVCERTVCRREKEDMCMCAVKEEERKRVVCCV
jgi:hypothetical protein